MKLSYSQNFEDIMLYRALHDCGERFYIDIGAWHPEKDSVTKIFYDSGWTGINIEPSHNYFRKIAKHRPNDTNLNIAIGASNGELEFFEVAGSGLSSLKKDAVSRAERYGFKVKRYQIQVRPLMSVVADHCSRQGVAFLKIDVEGLETEIIQSVDWTAFRPIIVVVEAIDPDTGEPTWDSWEQALVDASYEPVWFDGLNKFYLRNESSALRERFRLPPSLSDGFHLAPGHQFSLSKLERIALFLRGILPSSVYATLVSIYSMLRGR